jgi:hypothetical protein
MRGFRLEKGNSDLFRQVARDMMIYLHEETQRATLGCEGRDTCLNTMG